MRYKFIHIIGKNPRAGNPLPIDLAPAKLRPAGVGGGHVEFIVLYLLPVFCGYDMSERMDVVMRNHFGQPVVPLVK